ncbi:unnamed protein product [Meloidogyne enterolobii]|uniref:Uncharacterized protein n=1 Tax=Meloidogyne enterolobii TaxID=390850 RepID=A0ACB0ZRT9_MELEN
MAVDRRDTLCVEIYSNIVNFIINKINLELNEENKIINWRNGQQQKFVTVGLADFQSLENKLKNGNNFEQLCINYGAECLQQFFIRRIFTLEQAEYAAQCLPEWEERCAALPYLDNLQVLEMLAVQPLSVMSVIDDISIAPEASDTNLLSKLHSSHSNNESLYQKPKSSLLNQFAIRHYTGLVQYKVEGMILKNKDYFPSELSKLINESELKFLQKIFQNKEENNEEGDEISNELSEEELNENGNNEFKIKRIKQNTQCTIVRRSMNELMRRLESCPEAFFVRCLKTNDAQKEKLFETETVLRQMRQFDMLSTVAMCRATPPNYCDCAHTTGFICRTIFGDSCTEFVQFGKNKAFLKSEQHQFLEMLRSRRLHCCAALVQKCLLGWAKRQQYARLRWATLIFQKHWRGLVERKKFKIIIRGVTRLQAIIRSHQLVIRYQWLKSLIAHFQAFINICFYNFIFYLKANCRAVLIRYQLQCLVTRAERHCAMMARLDCQMEDEGEPPALDLHENELNNIIKEKNFGSLKILKYSNEKNCMEKELNNKNIKRITNNNSNNDAFKWNKYALANFQQTKCTPKHTRTLLERSLLSHKKHLDELVSLSIWRRLLQFIGDSDVTDFASFDGRNSKNNKSSSLPIMAKLKALYCQDFSDDEINYIKANILNYQTFQENGYILKKSIKIAKNILIGEFNWTAFDKAKFIVSVGIYRNELRDEIYSQICKQINCNPSPLSARRGWILMALCSSAFSPTNRLLPYLRNFVNSNAPNIFWQRYIAKQMSRTIKCGARREPCLKAEFAFICSIDNLNNSGLFVQINLPNEEIVDIPIHSQTTIADVFQFLTEKINLNESFGFGLFLSTGQNIRSLVVGGERLMDALALIEEQNDFYWKLYLRKELFLPLENNSDELFVDLSYRQIIKGLHYGEYQCNKEEDLALLAAQQYFVSINGKSTEIDISELEDNLSEYLPLNILKQNEDVNEKRREEINEEEEECQKWIQLILHAFRKKILNNGETLPPSVKQIKCDVLKFAAKHWPLNFSRFFEVYKFSGPPLPVNQLTMAVNSRGISLLDARCCDIQNQNKQQILFEIEFIELANIGYGRSKHEGADAIFISLLNGDRYTFQSPLARELSHLLSHILKSLHQNSIYAIALKDYNHCTVQHKMQTSENSVLSLLKGDLLILSSPLNKYLNNEEGKNEEENYLIDNVENTRSKMCGRVPLHSINILACTEKPAKEKLNNLLSSRKIIEQEIINTIESKQNNDLFEYPTFYTAAVDPFGMPLICGPFPQPHTLERFSSTNFRLPEDGNRPSDVFGAYNGGGSPEPELWRHSFEPLRAPLLKRISEQGNEAIAREVN